MLQCSGNYLTAVPGSLAASCPLLEQLGLDRNRLAFLPHTLGALARLVALSADDNPHLRCPPPEVPPPQPRSASPGRRSGLAWTGGRLGGWAVRDSEERHGRRGRERTRTRKAVESRRLKAEPLKTCTSFHSRVFDTLVLKM